MRTGPSDLDLVVAARRGDRTAFGQLVRRHGPRLLALARQMLGPDGRALEACPNCPPLYASLVQNLADLKALEDSRGIDELAERVVAALDAYSLPSEEPDDG